MCEAYLKAAGTADEKEAALTLKKELKEDVCSIDQVIPFFESEEGAKVLGADTAKGLAKAWQRPRTKQRLRV